MSSLLRVLLALSILGTQSSHAQDLHLVTEDFPPFTYPSATDPKHAKGPMAEVVQAVCKRLKASCKIELLPWQRAQALADRHEIDGIFSVVRSPDRDEKFYFSPMLVRSSYSVFRTKEYAFNYFQPYDLSHHTLGVYGPSGTSYVLEQNIRHVPDVSLSLIADNRRLLRMLESGRFGPQGLVVANKDVAMRLIEQEQLTNIEDAGELQIIEYGIALSKKRLTLQQAQVFNEAVWAVFTDGTIATILDQHGLKPAHVTP